MIEIHKYYYNYLFPMRFFMNFPEEVIRRRLLIDGDGTGDDRRLNVLLKTLIKWCNSSDEKPEERLVFSVIYNFYFQFY